MERVITFAYYSMLNGKIKVVFVVVAVVIDALVWTKWDFSVFAAEQLQGRVGGRGDGGPATPAATSVSDGVGYWPLNVPRLLLRAVLSDAFL